MNVAAWAVPLGLAVVLLVPVVVVALRLVDEAARLRMAARNLAALRPALLELRADARRVRATVQGLPRR